MSELGGFELPPLPVDAGGALGGLATGLEIPRSDEIAAEVDYEDSHDLIGDVEVPETDKVPVVADQERGKADKIVQPDSSSTEVDVLNPYGLTDKPVDIEPSTGDTSDSYDSYDWNDGIADRGKDLEKGSSVPKVEPDIIDAELVDMEPGEPEQPSIAEINNHNDLGTLVDAEIIPDDKAAKQPAIEQLSTAREADKDPGRIDGSYSLEVVDGDETHEPVYKANDAPVPFGRTESEPVDALEEELEDQAVKRGADVKAVAVAPSADKIAAQVAQDSAAETEALAGELGDDAADEMVQEQEDEKDEPSPANGGGNGHDKPPHNDQTDLPEPDEGDDYEPHDDSEEAANDEPDQDKAAESKARFWKQVTRRGVRGVGKKEVEAAHADVSEPEPKPGEADGHDGDDTSDVKKEREDDKTESSQDKVRQKHREDESPESDDKLKRLKPRELKHLKAVAEKKLEVLNPYEPDSERRAAKLAESIVDSDRKLADWNDKLASKGPLRRTLVLGREALGSTVERQANKLSERSDTRTAPLLLQIRDELHGKPHQPSPGAVKVDEIQQRFMLHSTQADDILRRLTLRQAERGTLRHVDGRSYRQRRIVAGEDHIAAKALLKRVRTDKLVSNLQRIDQLRQVQVPKRREAVNRAMQEADKALMQAPQKIRRGNAPAGHGKNARPFGQPRSSAVSRQAVMRSLLTNLAGRQARKDKEPQSPAAQLKAAKTRVVMARAALYQHKMSHRALAGVPGVRMLLAPKTVHAQKELKNAKDALRAVRVARRNQRGRF